MEVKIYHNPRCSKSRETLQLLNKHGIEPIVIDYLNAAPSKEELKKIIRLLSGNAHSMLRMKETAYKECGLSPESKAGEIIAAIQKYPVLLERPIVVVDNQKAAIGRPPENVRKLILKSSKGR